MNPIFKQKHSRSNCAPVPLVLAPGAVRLAVAPLLQRDAETTRCGGGGGGVKGSCGINGNVRGRWRGRGRALELVVEAVVVAAEGVLVRPVAAVVLQVADLRGVDAAAVVALELTGAARAVRRK